MSTITGQGPAERQSITPSSVAIADLDRDLLAAKAIVDADNRSAASGGRFSEFDVRAGAMRAVAASGVSCPRDTLQDVIDDVDARARELVIDLLHEEGDVPAHVKHLMSVDTARLKVDVAARFDALNGPGTTVPREAIASLADATLERGRTLDSGQIDAAAAIAGTDRLVTVTGPAGTGKTTMLRVARRALSGQQRNMIVVAPTKKAASVAGREIGTASSSLHALLVDHGWRFGEDAAGAQVWTRLAIGDTDPSIESIYRGPRRYPISRGDRIVVDEAGMVDLHTANALAELADETGAGIAMVGDHLQALPVGHSGAMAAMSRRSGAVVELTSVHRFRDPDYAALTLRMREPASREVAHEVAAALVRRNHVRQAADEHEARQVMVEAYFAHAGRGERVALVTGSNADAQAISEAIQQRRLDLGQLHMRRVAVGQGEQQLLEGDVVQTRRNDRETDVENRALWVVHSIGADSLRLQAVGDSGDARTVSHEYVANHVHLAYASTVHGIQGETMDAAVVGPGVDAAGLYVGMTRGRRSNTAIAIARNDRAAVDEIADTMMRGATEVTLQDATRGARVELGRAARTRRTERGSRTTVEDQRAQPRGEVGELDTLTREARATKERIEALGDSIRRDRDALTELESQIASHDACHHASTLQFDGDDPVAVARRLEAAWQETMDRLQEQRTERHSLVQGYAALVRTLDGAANGSTVTAASATDIEYPHRVGGDAAPTAVIPGTGSKSVRRL